MPVFLDLDSWKRRDHFHFFRNYDRPFFNICANVDVTTLREVTRSPAGPSFFLASLYLSLRAANAIEEFRYRIRGDGVLVHEVIHGGSTVLRDDQTFGFGYFDYDPDFNRFEKRAAEVLERVRTGPPTLDPRPDRDDLIHYSIIPWVAFTSFSHASRRDSENSVPKLVFGRHFKVGSSRLMPVSVEVHHALMDGLHVGRFFASFQELLADPPRAGGPAG